MFWARTEGIPTSSFSAPRFAPSTCHATFDHHTDAFSHGQIDPLHLLISWGNIFIIYTITKIAKTLTVDKVKLIGLF